MGRRLADIRYRVVPVASPAAGANLEVTSTGGFFWLLRSLVFDLTTDANVADRLAVLETTDGSNVYWRAAAGEVQAASLTHQYSAFPGADGSLTAGTVRGIPLDAFGLVIPPGHILRTDVDNIQVGDQLSAIALHVLEMESGRIAPAIATANLYIEEFDPTTVA